MSRRAQKFCGHVWLFSLQGINALFFLVSLWAACGGNPRWIALAWARLYLALMVQ